MRGQGKYFHDVHTLDVESLQWSQQVCGSPGECALVEVAPPESAPWWRWHPR